ncbi:MAG: VanW family protein [Patescibacteria group bacterium]
MQLKAIKVKIKPPYWLVITLTVFLVLIILFSFSAIIIEQVYTGKFYPNIWVGGINLSGLSYTDAYKRLEEKTLILQEKGFQFSYENKKVDVYPVQVSASDPDLSRELYKINISEPLNIGFAFGRDENIFINFISRVKLFFLKNEVPLQISVNKIETRIVLAQNFDEMLQKAEETKIDYLDNKPLFISGEPGETIDYDKFIFVFAKQLEFLNFEPVVLQEEMYEPKISLTSAQEFLSLISQVLERDSFFIKATITQSWYKDAFVQKQQMPKNIIQGGLELKWDNKNEKVFLGFNDEVFYDFLKPLAGQVEADALDAKFVIDNGRVKEFQPSQDGIKINFEKTLQEFEERLVGLKQDTSNVYTEQTEAKIKVNSINEIGIEELIGVGVSNFVGSPPNRIHNIKTGAASLNGLILKPGEEFSVNKSLGEINAITGYLPELVIKGNKTVPEYGGGLCQIATTMFRLVLDAGLPITERYPHAYRVVYYEPAGTDATIYSPHPDFRFINDTNNNLLLQTRIEGTEVIFEFWGKSDGRYVEIGKPVIYNITSPGPTKYIETEDLEPGETKCLESAHNGAETNLKRKVIYPNGDINEDNFYSKYRPWQAVCLVGIDPFIQATSTDEIINYE